MKRPSKTQILFLITIVLVIFSAVYLLRNIGHEQQGKQIAQMPVREDSPSITGEEMTEQVSEETNPQETQKTARRIVLVPDLVNATREEVAAFYQTEITGNDIAEVTLETMEKALGGDLIVAYRIKDLLERCDSAHISADSLETAIERANESATRLANKGEPITPEGRINVFLPGKKMYPTDELNRKHLTEWYEGCGKLRDTFSNDLRRQLDELAQQGDVMARYLYAIWAPATGATKEDLELELEWSQKALEYTNLNFRQGEAAGFLALGQSYHDSLFTRENQPLAKVLLIAAVECGVEDPGLALKLILPSSIRLGFDTTDGKQQEFEQIMSVAQELAGDCSGL